MADTNEKIKLVSLDSLAYTLQRIEARYQVKENGKGRSTNDFTNAYKQKVDELAPEDTEIATDEEVKDVIDDIFGPETEEAAAGEDETAGDGENLDGN